MSHELYGEPAKQLVVTFHGGTSMSLLLPRTRPVIRFSVLATLLLCLSWDAPLSAEDIPLNEQRVAKTFTVVLREVGDWRADAPCTVVITPGLGGSRSGDRFWQLACEVERHIPEANVLLIDWTEAASASFWGVPAPWIVAQRIDPVAAVAAKKLCERDVDPATVTLIGESFGNYVNGAVAKALGGVKGILVFNPASELGGYTPPDLRPHAPRVWSFHTYSPLDTNREISHSSLFLETPPDMNLIGQHTYGVVWLTCQLQRHKTAWLTLELTPPDRKSNAYCGKATLDGELEDVAVPRVVPSTEDLAEANASPHGN